MAEWVMDKLTGNKLRRGPSPAHHVVKGNLDTLVRESLQNSKDQRPEKSKTPVRVRYTLISLSGAKKKAFLKAMDWQSLRPHLDATTGDPGDIAARIRSGIAAVDSNKPLLCLRIEDFGAKGLEGGEFERNKNFCLLCRAEFKTSNVTGRGGSYGLGKAVLWRFSNLSTVLLSSIILGQETKGLRLFGRTDVAGHDLPNGDEYDSGGWFGKKTSGSDGDYAESIFGAKKLAESLYLDREGAAEPGTSALIVGFNEPEEDRTRDLTEIAEDILASAERWFWPSMSGAKPRLLVEVQVEEDGKVVFSKQADPAPKWAPFIRAREAAVTGQTAKTAGDVAETNLTFNVPGRDQPAAEQHPEIAASLRLRVTRGDVNSQDHEAANRVAVFRGAEMVIKYVETRRKPLDQLPFFGVLEAGKAFPQGNEPDKVEEFFRQSEPPLHNDWEYTEAVKHNYKIGAKSRLATLWSEIPDKVFSLIEENVTPKDQGPELLARLFPIGRSDKPIKAQKVKTRIKNSSYSSGKWNVEGEVVRANFDSKPWDVRIGFVAETDSGSGEYLKISQLQTKDPAATVSAMGPPATVTVAGTTDRFVFTAELEAPSTLETKDLDLTAIRFSH